MLKYLFMPIWIASTFCGYSAPVQGAERSKENSAPMILEDAQLDLITAQGGIVSLDLAASALGASAVSSTVGSVQTARTGILRIDLEPQTPARVVGVEPVDLILAAGRAQATGDSNAQCTASIVTAIKLIFMIHVSVATVSPTTATCSCAEFAIAPVAR